MNYKKKKIWLDGKTKFKYCWVKVYKTKEEMREAHRLHDPDQNTGDELGISSHLDVYQIHPDGTETLTGRCGILFLNLPWLGSGLIAHEFMHQILHAHLGNGKSYPYVIEDMKHEEMLLGYLTRAVAQFYRWYWRDIDGKF